MSFSAAIGSSPIAIITKADIKNDKIRLINGMSITSAHFGKISINT
tara:strand:+ start:258 stop:395 length:138 start_codon:yes stop_codon:yes gene_type:complete